MNQSKIFVGFIIVIATTIVGYVGLFKIDWDKKSSTPDMATSDTGQSREILTFVPADTLFFFGGLTPAPFQHAMDVVAPQHGWLKQVDWTKPLSEEERAKMPPAAIMMTSLTAKYMQYMQAPQTAAKKMGVGDEIDAVTYSVGFIPVMRIKIADAAAFNQFINDAEQHAKLTAEKLTVGDVTLRTYSFDIPEEQNPSQVKMLIGSNAEYAIISLSSSVEGKDAQNIIVGTKRPDSSLAQTTVLQDIKNKYDFNPAYIGYVNHREIMKGLTGEGSNEFGRMLDTLIRMGSTPATTGEAGANPDIAESENQAEESSMTSGLGNENPLDAIRSEACRKELMSMIDSWPQTVFGYTRMELDSKPKVMEARMLIESTDIAFMQDMQKIRGFIPAVIRQLSNRPVFGFGLGINIDTLAPFIAKAIQGFTSKEYQCEFLSQAKQNLIQANPAMALGMMSGMVAGVQGISATIMELDGSFNTSTPGAPPDIKALDAMISISSSNPQQLLLMAANMQPGMPPLQLPPDGTPIDFPVPIPLSNSAAVKLAIKGSHIVAYTGNKSAQLADKLAQEKLEANGLFSFNMDFGQYMKLITSAAQNIPSPDGDQKPVMSDKDKAMLEAMSNIKMQFVESFDIDKDGVAFDVKMTMD